jgi:hypothetical protein
MDLQEKISVTGVRESLLYEQWEGGLMFHLNFVLVEIHFLDHYEEQHFSYAGHRPLSVVQLANMRPSGKVLQPSVT